MIIPSNLVPFSKMDKADSKSFAVCEYENDTEFKDLFVNPDEYIAILKKYQGFINPDCSIYRDMPLAMMETLEPETVLVYSKMPDELEHKYPEVKFVEYPDWTSMVRKDKEENRSWSERPL